MKGEIKTVKEHTILQIHSEAVPILLQTHSVNACSVCRRLVDLQLNLAADERCLASDVYLAGPCIL